MSVTAAEGFEASGVEAGIRHAKKDVALVRSTAPAVGGAMFSRNKVQAACLQVNRAHLATAAPQAVVVNSGVANSATGVNAPASPWLTYKPLLVPAHTLSPSISSARERWPRRK